MVSGFKWRPPLVGPPPLCACGCGESVERSGRRWNKYIHNHHWKGKQRKPFSKKHRERISAATRAQHVDNHPTRGKKSPAGAAAKRGKRNPNYGKRGAAAPGWKDGTTKFRGYVLLYMPKHHRARGNYVAEHVVVAEQQLGRKLRRNEVVHHINGKKDDNRSENLYVTTPSKHYKLHGSAFALLCLLLEEGVVKFDREQGRYYRCPV